MRYQWGQLKKLFMSSAQRRELLLQHLQKYGMGLAEEQQIALFDVVCYGIYFYPEDARRWLRSSEQKELRNEINALAKLVVPSDLWPLRIEEMDIHLFNPYFTFDWLAYKNYYIQQERYRDFFDLDNSNPADGVYIRKFEASVSSPNNFEVWHQERGGGYPVLQTDNFDTLIDFLLDNYCVKKKVLVEEREGSHYLRWYTPLSE